jgi:hypothetical protein
LRRVAWQDVLMGADTDLIGRMGPELELLLPRLDERSRRLVLGAVARAAGDGGVTAVAKAAGASWQTVADGAAELASGDDAGPGRVRRPGGGRKKLEERDPRLIPALRDLLEASTRGDPQSLLTWTTLSVRGIAAELTAAGHRCAKNAVLRMLHAEGFSTQGNSRAVEGKRHPDRDAQFRYINDAAKEFLAAGDPVISIDTKKKELVGLYAQKGAEWRARGDPRRVRDHDFPDPRGAKAIPYGVYDPGDNSGFVNVGTDHDTAQFAVESVRRWWEATGKDRYPGAARLLVTCDAGGSNGYRLRAWKAELAAFAAQSGLEITVSHFAPGTSKWNKIEHRLFCHITRTWRGRPLTSYDVVVNTIAATATSTGLTVTAVLDAGRYPAGAQVTDAQMQRLEERFIARHGFHGDWNYTILPGPPPRPGPRPGARPRPAPAPPGPGPGRPGPARAHRPAARRRRRPGRRPGRSPAARRTRRPGPPAAPHRRQRLPAEGHLHRPHPGRHPLPAVRPARPRDRRPARLRPLHHRPRTAPHPPAPGRHRHRHPARARHPGHLPGPARLRRRRRHHHPALTAHTPSTPR